MNKQYTTDFLTAKPSLLSGVARLYDLFGTFDDYNESSSPSEADARAVNSDWNMTLQDFRGAVSAAKARIENDEAR